MTRTFLTNEDKEELERKIKEGLGKNVFTTAREELGTDPGNIDSAYIWGLYDALVTAYPDRIERKKIYNDDGTFENYEYIIGTGDYPIEGGYFDEDEDIKKPKYLVQSGIHGNERVAVLAAYRFARDLVEGKNLPEQFREGIIFRVLPVANPSGVNSKSRVNENGVDCNRNFNYNWVADDTEGKNSGAFAESEKETQSIVNWLKANTDASLFIDCHNSSLNDYKEVATVFGIHNQDKRTAMRGLDRIVPFWREELDGEKLFSYASEDDILGSCGAYATNKLGIRSVTLECSARQDDPGTSFTPVSIAIGAEAIGNILLQFYERAEDVNYAKEGQFAIADGKGGIQWLTAYTVGEVGY